MKTEPAIGMDTELLTKILRDVRSTYYCVVVTLYVILFLGFAAIVAGAYIYLTSIY